MFIETQRERRGHAFQPPVAEGGSWNVLAL
jgi:hypothetical protein